MRKKGLYEVYSDKKITEKQFLRMLMGSVFSILLCMSCLVGTTWAWYSYDISNTDNVIQLGSFLADVVVNPKGQQKAVRTMDSKTYYLTPGSYTVTVQCPSSSSASGYCVVILNGVEYQTARIRTDDDPLKFTVIISEAENTNEKNDGENFAAELVILPIWGMPTSDSVLEEGSEIEGSALTSVDTTDNFTEAETSEIKSDEETTVVTETPTDEETPTTTAVTGTTESSTTTEASSESVATTAATENPTDEETPTTTAATDTTESSTTTETTGETAETTAATEEPTEKETSATTESTDTAE